MEIRQLSERDRWAADAFLLQHRDSSMFLRANIRRVGFEYSGKLYEATYVAGFESDRIIGMISHSWNGLLLVQAPVEADALAHAVVAASGRKVTGFSGPLDQVRRVRAALELSDVPAQLDAEEVLYGLDLARLRVPASAPELVCRRARDEDRAELVRFRLDYEVETLSGDGGEESNAKAAAFLDAQVDAGLAWVALVEGERVSLSAFNAALPDIVQLGGIFTPPQHRGKSYAKRVIAAQLLAAREAGATRAVLFTKNPSAVRCYEALGFERLSDFALVLLK
jgi:predicted GNAT family acetyltransferase